MWICAKLSGGVARVRGLIMAGMTFLFVIREILLILRVEKD